MPRSKPKSAHRARSLKSGARRVSRSELFAELDIPLPPDHPPPLPEKHGRLLDFATSDERKCMPVTSGFLDYFPDAVPAAAEVSFLGNEKHNPGQPLHHSRGKSADHADCIARHLIQRGGFELVRIGDKVYKVRHSACLMWRASAMLQEELEAEKNLELPRGAKEV